MRYLPHTPEDIAAMLQVVGVESMADLFFMVPSECRRRDTPDLPDLNEMGVVRHYTRLSQWNFGVDTGMYPLGSCTMKYNPKINEKCSQLEGFVGRQNGARWNGWMKRWLAGNPVWWG